MNKEQFLSKAIIAMSAVFAGVLIFHGAQNILEVGGFVSPLYDGDIESPFGEPLPEGPIPKDLLGELQIMGGAFAMINGYITSKRYKMVKAFKALEERVAELEKRKQEA